MKYENQRGCKIMEVIQAITLEGNGTEENVYRSVAWYYDRDGTLLARNDPIRDANLSDGNRID